MKALIINIFALFLILSISAKLFSQEIEIELTFTSDTVIFPFENIETISELSMEGELSLHNDTSLVRVILEDEYGIQYMILEAYPLICIDTSFSFSHHCDETYFLDQVNPYSIIIQIINGSLNLKRLYYTTDPKENSVEERYKAKRAMDAEKIETMSQIIPLLSMGWIAGDNGIVSKYYEQKRHMFGDGYNLLGYDYYKEGVFEFIGHSEYQKADPDLVKQFDWRDRHGANDPSSPYWDGDMLGTGWLTSVKNQWPYGTCWAFSAAGLVEAITNLYTNDTLDFDLSEQHLISCVEGDCEGGDDNEALIFVKDSGIVTEQCFPYDTVNCPSDCEDQCNPPTDIFQINDIFEALAYNHDSIRIAIVNYGPCSIGYLHHGIENVPHSVNIIGFVFDWADSSLTWIIKNSWGINGWGVNGIGTIKIPSIWHATFIETPVFINDTALNVNCYDHDEDGFCFWGIGKVKPENCNCEEELEDCNDYDRFVGAYDENYNCSCLLEFDTANHHISVDTTWSETTYVNYQVVIDSGACLTINSYAAFVPEAGIRVLQGGKLILDSAYLTKVCPELWDGIEVLGTDTLQAMDEYFGKVVVQNNSVIEFARVGIANHCKNCGYYQAQSGGIISSENSTFRDNERDILFAPFNTFWFGHDLPYACTVENCQFISTDLLYPEHIPIAHIEMKDIYGVMIYGCRFQNQSNLEYIPFPLRGTGISAIDSYFMINPYCLTPNTPCEDFDTCRFSLLEYGIKALDSRSKRTLNIQSLKFDSNFIAISLSGLEYAAVLSNKIECLKYKLVLQPDRFAGGLFMEGCTGYHVENNNIYAHFNSMESGYSPCYGIGIKNSGPDHNEIYNNNFEGLSAGIYTIGVNRGKETGLCLKCNDMISNKNDIIVVDINDPPLGTYMGINRYQGDPNDSTSFDAPAGNVFSDDFNHDAIPESLEYYNYFNSGEDLRYTHHALNQIYLVRPLDSNYTQETIELKGWNLLGYVKETACPSGLGGGGGTKSSNSPRSIIKESDIRIDSLNTQLELLIDGGSTEELNFEVMTSMPNEGLEMRQELLAESPYLSDTVMKQAIYKEDVLPNAMIRDILEANPQSAKSVEILSTLDSRFEPMPEYMMVQIMQGKKYLGAKEVLEAKIQSWKQIRSKAKADMIREFLLDTNMINPLDSIIAFLEDETDLNSKYELALAYWNKLDTANAILTINSIPLQFALNENQSAVHQQFNDYFEILQQIEDSNWRACDLDSTSVLDLFELMEVGDFDIEAHARGLLVKGGFLDYIETIKLPDYTKSSGLLYNSEGNSAKEQQKDYLRLFPNPAGDYIIAFYDIEPKWQYGIITIYDIKGNLLGKYKVNSGENQIVLDLKDFPNGFYMIGLHANNRLLEAEKVSKSRY